MARRKLEERNTRKLSKKSNGSYSVTLPVEAVRELGWKKGQKLVVRKSGSKIIIEDWEK
jgi:bifunctional DNA-binding transcriptional regulator/antitoxin component of YhaV-PrlF toxin-antitoxin module